MRLKISIVTVTFSFLIGGCIPFASNELNTKIWMSKEERIQQYKERLDSEIGKEFYSTMNKAELCRTQECNNISETVTEYRYEWEDKTDPPRKCVFAWTVDASQSEVAPPNEEYFLGLGKKIKWRYISSPDQCLGGLDFYGPW